MASSRPAVFAFPGPETARWGYGSIPGTDIDAPEDSPVTQASRLTAELKSLDNASRNGFVRSGLICLQIRDSRGWSELGYSSFDEWIASSAPYSRSSCYAAMKTLESLKDIPTEKLADIPQKNLHVLKSLSTGVRGDAEVLRNASEMPSDAFTEFIAQNHPSQHLEPRKGGRKLSASLWSLLDQAVEKAVQQYGFVDWEDALESILADYLASEPKS